MVARSRLSVLSARKSARSSRPFVIYMQHVYRAMHHLSATGMMEDVYTLNELTQNYFMRISCTLPISDSVEEFNKLAKFFLRNYSRFPESARNIDSKNFYSMGFRNMYHCAMRCAIQCDDDEDFSRMKYFIDELRDRCKKRSKGYRRIATCASFSSTRPLRGGQGGGGGEGGG